MSTRVRASGGDTGTGLAGEGGERVITATVAAGPHYELRALASESVCKAHNICVWTDNYYRGLALVMSGMAPEASASRADVHPAPPVVSPTRSPAAGVNPTAALAGADDGRGTDPKFDSSVIR